MTHFHNPLATALYHRLTGNLGLVPACKPKNGLGELVLNISNTCNLACRYCFADKGRYGANGRVMTRETAKSSIDAMLTRFGNIRSVKFFGGEPLLNSEIIAYCCGYFETLRGKGAIPFLPRYGIVTNFISITDKIMSVLQRHKIGTTVSLDGPPDVNDACRVFPDTTGTFRVVDNFLKSRRYEFEEHYLGIEAVYTPFHTEKGISMADLYDYLGDRYSITNVVIHPLVENEWSDTLFRGISPSTLQKYRETMYDTSSDYGRYIAGEISRGRYIGVAYSVLNDMLTPAQTDIYCGLGNNTISVMADGAVYPCYMLANQRDYYMGDISAAPACFEDSFSKVQSRFINSKKSTNPYCMDCDIVKTCSACQGSMYGKWHEIGKPVPLLCDYYTGLREGVLLELDKIAADNANWVTFIETLQKMSSIRNRLESPEKGNTLVC